MIRLTLWVVIRLRGEPDRRPDEKMALKMLRLHKTYHAVLVEDDPSIKNMLQKTLENVVTYGEIDEDTLALLLERRGRLTGNKKITKEYLQKLGYSDFKELAKALISGQIKIRDLPELKPVFRLRPPSGGFKGTIKKHYKDGGESGYRGQDINELLKRML